MIQEWLANHRRWPGFPGWGGAPGPDRGLTIDQVFLPFWEFVQQHYRKHGQLTNEARSIRYALTPLLRTYGGWPAQGFGPLALKSYRQGLINRGLARSHINNQMGRVKRFFKWVTENEMVPPTVLQGLQAVAGLRHGRSLARETAPVKPVPDADVEAVLGHVSPQVGAMIRLQRLTGMRPGEVVILRGRDLDTTERGSPRKKTRPHITSGASGVFAQKRRFCAPLGMAKP